MPYPKVTTEFVDNTMRVPQGSVVAAIGYTVLGKLNTPTRVRTVSEFYKLFGGTFPATGTPIVGGATLTETQDNLSAEAFQFPLQCIKALEHGAELLVVSVAKYLNENYGTGGTVDGAKASKNHKGGSLTTITTITPASKKFTFTGTLLASKELSAGTPIYVKADSQVQGYYTIASAAEVSGNTEVVVNEIIPVGATPSYKAAYLANKTGDDLLKISATSEGAWGNRVLVRFEPQTNYSSFTVGTTPPTPARVNIHVRVAFNPTLNYTLTGVPTEMTAAELTQLNARSPLVNFEILSGTTANFPMSAKVVLENGDKEYSANAVVGNNTTGLGVYALNNHLTSYEMLTAMYSNSPQVVDTIALYCETRHKKHIMSIPQGISLTAVADYLNRQGNYVGGNRINSQFTRAVYGDFIVPQVDGIANLTSTINCIGTYCGLYSKALKTGKVWNALPTFGYKVEGVSLLVDPATAQYEDADIAYSAGANMFATNSMNDVVVVGNNTMYPTTSLFSEVTVTDLLTYIEETIWKPSAEKVKHQPNNEYTWMALYSEFSSKIDKYNLIPTAMSKYEYFGDQFTTAYQNLTVNNLPDIQARKYKVRILFYPYPTLEAIEATFELNF